MSMALPLVCTLLFTAVVLSAQDPQPLTKTLELQMPKTADDDMPGTRGASVTWHPALKKYYASFAGNAAYPMAVFDNKGTRTSSENLSTRIDTRGLWYNPSSKMISGNGYGSKGWFYYTLDNRGNPTDVYISKRKMNQPDSQSVGVYNSTDKQVLFLFRSHVYKYNSDGQLVDSLAIHWGRKKADVAAGNEDLSIQPEAYNFSSLVYTGIKEQEIGFLNIENKQIELYDIKTGFLTKTLALPESATAEPVFNFAYANGLYWLFNRGLRKWEGYK